MGIVRQSYKGRADRVKINNDANNVHIKITAPARRPMMFNINTDKELKVAVSK